MKTLISILTALLLLGVSPALASENGGGSQHGGGYGGGGHGGGGGCGGGCGGGGGHPGGGGGHYGGNINVNVNANANASAYAGAGAGAYINARGYDVGAIRGGGGYGGSVIHGSGGVDMGGGYGYGAGYAVVVRGPGYGPSRPFGYVAQGFGRRYVTTDRCCAPRPAPCYDNCGGGYPPAPPPPPPPPPSCDCQGGHGHGGHDDNHGGGYGYQQNYSDVRGGSSYSRYESYSESSSGGYQGGDRYSHRRDDGPRYAPIPYQASPLEPVAYDQGGYGQSYAPPQVQYQPAYPEPAYAEPQVYQPAPVHIQVPQDYYGDLPPGDTGEGYPYRQEPGERG
ncbi:hypothetical protein [Brevundimonas sp.]|uniref:hypothetical protein n=1 Tax=Brevundimonas sp. TaxID=1871086 RepID=UPI003D1449D8